MKVKNQKNFKEGDFFMKKILPIFMVVFILFTLAGCSGSNGEGDSSSPDTKAVESKADKEDKPAEKVKLRIAYDGGGKSFPEGVDENNNPYIQWLREQSGYDIEIIVLPGEDADGKVNLMLAVNDIPDIFTLTQKASTLFKNLADYGVIKSIDNELKNAPNLNANIPESYWLSVKSDGKTYGVPRLRTQHGSPIPLARTDWLERLGLEFPVTSEEYYEVAKAFTENDPDGDGNANTLGMTFVGTSPAMHGMDSIFGGFGVPRDGYDDLAGIWLERDGKLSYTGTWKENKDALEWLQKIYDDGYLDKEFITNVWSINREKFSSGKVGLTVVSPPSASDFRSRTLKANPDAAVETQDEMLRFRVDGITPMYAFPSRSMGYACVTNNLEASVKVLDILASEEAIKNIWGGGKGVVYDIVKNADGSDGFIWKDDEKAKADTYRHKLFGVVGVDDKIIMPQLAIDEKTEWRVTTVYEPLAKMQNSKDSEYAYNLYLGTPTPTYKEKWTELRDLEKQVLMEIITGAEPVEYYDQFIKDWNERGGAAITEEVNEWYSKIK